jgi:hypothetical protein
LSSLTISEQGLEVIESTNLKYFTKEMTAEFYALKGMFLAQINKYVYCGGRCRCYSFSLRVLSQKPRGFMGHSVWCPLQRGAKLAAVPCVALHSFLGRASCMTIDLSLSLCLRSPVVSFVCSVVLAGLVALPSQG